MVIWKLHRSSPFEIISQRKRFKVLSIIVGLRQLMSIAIPMQKTHMHMPTLC